MNELALFAGAGGGLLASKLLRWRTVCAVEIDDYNRNVIVARQNDGSLEPFPIWDDVRTFDGRPWRGIVDVVSGGFPCQDISFAGKREGITGKSSSLWNEFARIVEECQPRFVLVENSGQLNARGLEAVIQRLASMGFDAEWGVFRASDTGAPHRRERTFILAYTVQSWLKGDWWRCGVEGRECGLQETCAECREGTSAPYGMWQTESGLERVVHDGVAYGLDRHYAIGNGQVPDVVVKAWHVLTQTAERRNRDE